MKSLKVKVSWVKYMYICTWEQCVLVFELELYITYMYIYVTHDVTIDSQNNNMSGLKTGNIVH